MFNSQRVFYFTYLAPFFKKWFQFIGFFVYINKVLHFKAVGRPQGKAAVKAHRIGHIVLFGK